MENHRIEYYLNQIVLGYLKFKYQNLCLKITHPSLESRCDADIIYSEVLEMAYLDGLYNDHELMSFLYQMDIWSDYKENMVESLKKDIEEFKVKMYQLTLKENEMAVARKALRVAESTLFQLLKDRHSYDYISAKGSAKIARDNYLLLSSLKYNNNECVFKDVNNEQVDILLPLISFCYTHRIQEQDVRFISRSEPWRTTWILSKNPHAIFNKSVVDLTDDQRSLCAFSKFYDNVYESHECPHESIVNDDDLLDGWLILQKRKRDKEQNVKIVDNNISKNAKIKNADEVYVLTDSKDMAEKIDDMNDIGAKIVKGQRMRELKKRGVVNELDMPDVRQRLVAEAQTKIMQRLKGK